MLYTQENVLLMVIVGLFIVYLFRNVIIEGLTSNAPVELALPKFLKRSEPTKLSEKAKARLDTCDRPPPSGMDAQALKRYNERCNIPTAYNDTETGYLLSPGTVRRLKSGRTVATNVDTRYPEATEDSKKAQAVIMQRRIDALSKEIEQLKKQMRK